MSLTYVDYHGGYFVEVGVVAGALAGLVPEIGGFDPILSSLTNCAVPVGTFPVEATTQSYLDKGEPTRVRLLGEKPRAVPYDGQSDWAAYGGGFASIVRGISVLARGSSNSFVTTGEYNVLHSAYRGDLGPRQIPIRFLNNYTRAYWQGVAWLGGNSHLLPAHSIDLWYGSYHTVEGVAGLQGLQFLAHFADEGPYDRSIFSIDLPTLLAHWVSVAGGTDWVSFGGGWRDSYAWGWGTSIRGVTVSYNELTHITSVRYDLRHGGNWWNNAPSPDHYAFMREYRVQLLFSSDHNVAPADHHFSGVEALGDVGKTFIHVTAELVSRSNAGHSWDVWEAGLAGCDVHVELTGDRVYLSHPFKASDGGAKLVELDRFVHRGPRAAFTEEVRARMHDIRASSFQSCSDAIESLSAGVDTNLIEALSELRELSGLLPDLRKALSAALQLKRGNVVSSVLDMADFLTALRLQHQFAWSPDLALIEETMPKLGAVVQKLSSIADSSTATGYGSLTYDFPRGEFGRESSTLQTRSKVVVNRHGKDVLTNILGAKSLGLLPSPSSLWDLVPLSFVVDWLINVGSRLQDMENLSILALLDIRVIVHTYRVESILDADELSRYGLSNATAQGSDPLSMRVFVRDVSAYAPFPRQSRYDFRLPSRPPNWMTAGSLGWQLIAAR